jgi:hypothetical protein
MGLGIRANLGATAEVSGGWGGQVATYMDE